MDDRYTIHSFSQKIKDIGTDLFGMTYKDRHLLISIGSHMRQIDPDVWINYVLNQTKDLSHCIIDDMRYQNEYDILKNNGFVFIQLQVTPHIQEQRIKKLYPSTYKDHLRNVDDLSEQNNFNWAPRYEPILQIDNREDSQKVHQKVFTFLQKHE